jgi:subtilisin family serine protease
VRRFAQCAALTTLVLLPTIAACSSAYESDTTLGGETAQNNGAAGAGSAVGVPPPPLVRPRLPDLSEHDRDGDRIDDKLEVTNASSQPVAIEILLTRPTLTRDLASFGQNGGRLRHVFARVSYGWTGSIRRSALASLREDLGSSLLFIAASQPMVTQLDEATRTGRVRPIWHADFGGKADGISGDPATTIGIIDTGVDGTHLDLRDRMAGFRDYSSDAASQPRDVWGHGTHVTSIALGSGAAFGTGPGVLRYTSAGDLSGQAGGTFLPAPIHTPRYLGSSSSTTVSVNAVWLGGVATSLFAAHSADTDASWTKFAVVTGTSPQVIPDASDASTAARYSDSLSQTSPTAIGNFAVIDKVASYPGVADGFNAFRGVAPNCRWFGAKIFNDRGEGDSTTTAEALDDLVTLSSRDNIQIINLSITSDAGTDAALRAKVNTAIDNGIVVVVAAGNDGPTGSTPDPGLANAAITVGATNDVNELTTYTSAGFPPSDASEDLKPDILAPGGSSFRSLILAADSNTTDATNSSLADLEPDDYTGMQGTSMAAPFVAGSVALMIDAWQRSGRAWSFSSSDEPLLMKMLLLAAATETNTPREQGAGGDPVLGRAVSPKDPFEGFGIVNPDASVEAIALALPGTFSGGLSATPPARLEWEPRAWGRHVALRAGDPLSLTLAVPATEDLDLYLYSGTPDANGAPVIGAASVHEGKGVAESISFVAAAPETAYVFVKRISGYGEFSLTAVHGGSCGNGVLDSGEACDPAILGGATCCDAACQSLPATSSCDDGNACTRGDHCAAGKCVGGDVVVCSNTNECQLAGSCDPSTGQCSTRAASNGTACSLGTCSIGVCAPEAEAGAGGAPPDNALEAGAGGLVEQTGAGDDWGGAAGQPNARPNPPLKAAGAGCACSAAARSKNTALGTWPAGALWLLCAAGRKRRGARVRSTAPR